MLKSIYNSQRKGKENKNSHVNYSAIKTLKKQERFIARRFGVIVTPLSRD